MDTPLNILVVEDHDDLREATVTALDSLGYAAHGADCAETMDEMLSDLSPDVLLLDLNLPGEDGLSIARRLRGALPNMGIIMVTARNQGRDITNGYDSGADIYVTKPTSPEELHAAIQALARRMQPQANLVLNGNNLHRNDHLCVEQEVFPQRNQRSRAICDLLIKHEGKAPTLDELAQQFGRSAKLLNEEFADEFGQSIYSFMSEHRLIQAHAALAQTDVPIKQLAARLGYAHVNNFSIAFKRRYGYPPGSLRRTMHSEI
jgi:DNA-binding response OmpR family regulator